MFGGQYYKATYFRARFWNGDVASGSQTYREVCRNSVIKGRGVTLGRSVALGSCYSKIAFPWYADELVVTGNQSVAGQGLSVGVEFGALCLHLHIAGSGLGISVSFGPPNVVLELVGIGYWTIEDTFVIELGEGVGEWVIGSTFEVQ